MKDDESLVRMIYNVPIGGNGASLSFETSFFRDAPAAQIIGVVEKLENVAARQVAKGQLQALEDSALRLEAQSKVAMDSYDRLRGQAAESAPLSQAERARLSSDLDVAKANVEHLGREHALLEAKLAAVKNFLEEA